MSPITRVLSLLALMIPASQAWIQLSPYGMYDFADFAFDRPSSFHFAPTPQRPAWSQTSQEYSLQMRLPDLEPTSVTATLAESDSEHAPTTLRVTGTRIIPSCTCTPTIQKEVALPYRPRAEDIQVEYDDGILSITLERHAKADAPIVVPVKSAKDKAPTVQEKKQITAPEEVARPTLDEQERSALEKFRSAAAAVAAISSGSHGDSSQPEGSSATV